MDYLTREIHSYVRSQGVATFSQIDAHIKAHPGCIKQIAGEWRRRRVRRQAVPMCHPSLVLPPPQHPRPCIQHAHQLTSHAVSCRPEIAAGTWLRDGRLL